jgi:hypothetical protein
VADLFDWIATEAATAELHAREQNARENGRDERDCHRHRNGPVELELASLAQPLGKYDDVHAIILVAS